MPRSPSVRQASASKLLDDGAHLFGLGGGPLLEEDHFAADGQISVDAGQGDIRQHENQNKFECEPHGESLCQWTVAICPSGEFCRAPKRPRNRPRMPLYAIISPIL